MITVLALATAGGALLLARRSRRRRTRPAADAAAALPELLELLVALIRAGCTPPEAVRRAATRVPRPISPPVHRVVARLDQGQRFADAVRELALAVPAAQPAVDLLATADRYGLPLAPVLDRLADEARAQRRRAAEAAARELPVRLAFPLVCCTLPSFAVLTIVPLVAASLGSLRGLGP